jgi:zinc finger MYND domain-containing protein 10
MNSSDEYVMESFVTFDKMPFIIYDLLLTEVWKEKVYSVIKNKISAVNSIRQYMSVSSREEPQFSARFEHVS